MNKLMRSWFKAKNIPLAIQGIAFIFFLMITFLIGNLTGTFLFSSMKQDGPAYQYNQQTPLPPPPAAQQNGTPAAQQNQTIKGLSIKIPGENASTQEKAAFSQAINANAKETNVILIQAACTLNPPVVRIKEGSSLTFRNQDSREHRVVIYVEEIAVPAGGEKSVRAQFKNGPGIYGIACDNASGTGFLELTSAKADR